MERLTEWSYLAGMRTGDLKVGVDERKAFDRLAAYEDTGLKPEEVKEFLEDVESRFVLWINKRYGIPATKFMDIMQAEKDGQMVVQRHGLWETHLLPLAWKCSVCGFKNSFKSGRKTEYLNYCPCCGAKMDKKENEVDDEID